MKRFEHGGDINSFAKEINCKSKEIIDLSSNINFLKPKSNINFNKVDISSYGNYYDLYKTIAKHYEVKNSNIELYNGASSAIFSLFRNLDLKVCTIYSPAYLEYKKAAKLFSYKLYKINRFKGLNQEVEKNSLVVFVNPSTPDGKYYNLDSLMKLWIEKKCTILIDESFLEFTNKKSMTKYLKTYDKLYILKSMTKFYSCAGVRMGTIISSKKNIANLKQKEPLWKISTYDKNYIISVLQDKIFAKKTIKKTNKNKENLEKILASYGFIKKVFKSDANFLLIELKGLDAKIFQEYLKREKIMVRDCSNFDFLNSSYVRIAIKDKKSISKLKKALSKIDKG